MREYTIKIVIALVALYVLFKINPKLTLFSNARSAEMESGSRENLSFLFNGCVVSSRGSLLERKPVP